MAMGLSDDSRERVPALSVGDKVPLHPALTDVPVATFSLAPIFDALAYATKSEGAGAAGLWTAAAGCLWAVPTAASGVLDYLRAPSQSPVKRIGITHAALNTAALTLMIGSLAARGFGRRPTGLSLALSAGAGGIVTYSSHLGGIMVYREGMRVSAARRPGDAWEPAQPDAAAVVPAAEPHVPGMPGTAGDAHTFAAGGPGEPVDDTTLEEAEAGIDDEAEGRADAA
jgi:uncharacterized membrane protein